MLLSETIRLGEFAAAPVYKHWLIQKNGGTCGCAVGRTVIAAGFQLDKRQPVASFFKITDFFNKQWPWTLEVDQADVPLTYHGAKVKIFYYGYFNEQGMNENPVLYYMSDLYENHKYTIQQIADAIEKLEAKYNITEDNNERSGSIQQDSNTPALARA